MRLTSELVMQAYYAGVFPMAENRDDKEFMWVEPKERGIIDLDEFHIPKRLARTMRHHPYDIRFDHDFAAVINACAQREETWINQDIEDVFIELHTLGHAHSVEAYDAQNTLVGGLYGLAIGGLFCGESMFSTATDASKIALVALVERLKENGFVLLDTQFITEHLRQFGAKTIPQEEYLLRARVAIERGIPVGA